jgi:glutamyl-tRNA synthetase
MTPSHNEKIVSRFAPSPTGFMHVGSIRTALYSYLWARKNKGTFILRIEDTDKEREVAGSIAHIQESLRWLGIEWDYGPENPGVFNSCIQSERLPLYKKYAEKLVAEGHAYPDPYTEEELQTLREKAKAENRPFLFRDHRPTDMHVWDGESTLRFRVPKIERTTWHDEVRGDMEAGEEALDDFVLMKKDGYPTYNFAHIVDDYEMGVTHIMRADEFISSTPRFISLHNALGFPIPKFVTLPPLLREDKTKKLGKRDGAKDVLEYREEGYLPSAMMNFLALIGWNPGTDQEIFSHDELVNAFTIEGIQTGGALLNEEKLKWVNREHILRFSDAEFGAFVHLWLPESTKAQPQFSESRLNKLLPTIRERVSIGKDITEQMEAGEYDFAFSAPQVDPQLVKWKNDTSPKETLIRLQRLAEIVSQIPEESTPESVKEYIWGYATETGKGEVLWPLRVALTGKEKSPDPFTVIHTIGSGEAYKRIRGACDTILKTS